MPSCARAGLGPVEQPLERGAAPDRLGSAAEVDHLAVHPVADRPPEVLLDLAVAQRRAAPRSRARRSRAQPGRCRRRSGRPARRTPRRGPGRRRSAPRRCRRVVGPHAPPELGRLDDRAGPLEEADEVRVRLPVAEGLGDAAAREGAGEDLGADRVQAGVTAVEERRVGGDARAAAAAARAASRRRRSRGRRRARPRGRAGSRCCCAARPSRVPRAGGCSAACR